MPSNQVSTTTPGMQEAMKKFDDTIKLFTGKLSVVNNEMSVLQASWTGDASGVFNQAMDAWEENFQRVINALIGMAETMGVNVKIYVQAEEEASGQAANWATALPSF